jgi:hypothetical protein
MRRPSRVRREARTSRPDPPQIVPDRELVHAHRHRGLRAQLRQRRRRPLAARAIVLRVPPVCWMPSMRTGRPLASIVRARRRLSKPSQPSDTSSAPPTFGCVHSFSIIASAYALG